MTIGILGQVDLPAATNATIYTVPAATVTSFAVCITNRTAAAISVRLALCATGSPSNAEYVEYDASVPGYGVLERGGLVLQAGKNVVAYAASTGVSINVYGYEE